ncbi:MAG: hypothetical protein IJC65_07180 [Oscillospiraceae bacterium]|nr:hypothetical protein [Oscillospiraceae bacterium]
MNIGFKKAVISIGTAVVMLTSVFAGSVVASSTNEITVSPTVSTVKPGESFDVSVGFEAGDNGASGFQLFLHYDEELLDVYVPTTSELNGKYDSQSRFSVITNYTYGEGVVKIVGANMSANNITVDTALSLVTFSAKDDASGTANVWISVEKLVYNDDGSMVSTPYSAPTSSNPVKIKIAAPTTTTTTTKATTTPTTTTTTTPVTTTTTTPSETTTTTTTPSETTTTTTEATKAPTTSATTTEATTTTTTKATTTPTTTTTTTPVTTTTTTPSETTTTTTTEATTTEATTTEEVTEATTTEAATSETTTQQTEEQPEVTTTTTENTETEEPSEDAVVITDEDPLYELSQGAEEYDETLVDPYCINLKDYVSDFDKSYNVKVSITSDGYATGSISMNDVEGNWTKYYQNTDSEVWEATNITLDKNDALVFVQLFYLKENSTFTIEKIEITPYMAEASDDEVTEEEIVDTNVTIPEEDVEEGVTKEDVEQAVQDMPENDKNPQTSDSSKSVMAVGLVVLELIGMAATLFIFGKKKEVEEPAE